MNYTLATAAQILIGRHTFWGPYTATKYLHAEPGVFVVLDLARDGSWTVLDVDVAENVQEQFGKHERWGAWMKYARGRTAVAALSSPGWEVGERRAIAAEIRGKYHPPCGDYVTHSLTSNVDGCGRRE